MELGSVAIVLIVCAIVSAKWTMELGRGQVSQLLHGIGGLLLGPLVLLILYVHLLRRRLAEAER